MTGRRYHPEAGLSWEEKTLLIMNKAEAKRNAALREVARWKAEVKRLKRLLKIGRCGDES